MKQTIYSICMALCLCFITTSCEDSFDDLDKAYHPTDTELSDTALALNSIIDHIAGAGGKYSCTVKAGEGVSWKITGAPSWIKFSQTTGKGSTKITYTVEQNPSTVTERTEHFYLESTQQQLPFKLTYKARQHARPTATAVDLGLSVKWASCNVGATKPEEFGGYYAWGEIEEKDNYTDKTYKWYDPKKSKEYLPYIIKYNSDSDDGIVDNKTRLESEDDVARVMWGGKWRMPTYAEMYELKTKCNWKYGYHNDVFGLFATGPNGNSIFIPCANHIVGDDPGSSFDRLIFLCSDIKKGNSWPSSLLFLYYGKGLKNEYYFEITSSNRVLGYSVRPVTN